MLASVEMLPISVARGNHATALAPVNAVENVAHPNDLLQSASASLPES